MKIVSWNANGKFREKIKLFSPSDIDVMVVQECEKTEKSDEAYKSNGWEYQWVSENKHRGLGVFVPKGKECIPLDWKISECKYFLPVSVSENITVVGVWAMGGRSKSVSYAGQITCFLKNHIDTISSSRTFLVGDFNSNAIWDKRHRVANHTKNNNRLAEVALKSLYHVIENEEQGKETKPTFFLYRNREKPYHMDYFYVPEILMEYATIEVGSQDKWLKFSDHMPLFVDLNIPTGS